MPPKLLTLSGSSRPTSSNRRLLAAVPALLPGREIVAGTELLFVLPLFRAEADRAPWPAAVLRWRAAVADADAVLISTPEYLHNLPAALKNGLEWLSSSGELQGKIVLPITLTPHAPRGDKALASLRQSLLALQANLPAEASIYLSDLEYRADQSLADCPGRDLLVAVLDLLPRKA